jgi:hypothetical protein
MKKWAQVAYNIQQSDTKSCLAIVLSILIGGCMASICNAPYLIVWLGLWLPILFFIPNYMEFTFERMGLAPSGVEVLDRKYFQVVNGVEYFNFKLYEKEHKV